jgi:hypothetical protein
MKRRHPPRRRTRDHGPNRLIAVARRLEKLALLEARGSRLPAPAEVAEVVNFCGPEVGRLVLLETVEKLTRTGEKSTLLKLGQTAVVRALRELRDDDF